MSTRVLDAAGLWVSGKAFGLVSVVRVHLDRLLRDISTDGEGLLTAP
ncbi:hypothetical protein [Streptomyces sp. LN785]